MHDNDSYDGLYAQVCMFYDMTSKGLRVASLVVGTKSTLYDMTSKGLRVASLLVGTKSTLHDMISK